MKLFSNTKISLKTREKCFSLVLGFLSFQSFQSLERLDMRIISIIALKGM